MSYQPHTFNINWPAAQWAKRALGIEGHVTIAYSDPGMGAWGYQDEDEDGWLIVLHPHLPFEFASLCLWHELAHVRQEEQDYGGNDELFLDDYNRVMEWMGIGGDKTYGTVSPQTIEEQRLYCLSPWEAEASLTVWEHRTWVLTKPTRRSPLRPHVQGPQHLVGMLAALEVDLHEIIDLGTQYREGMRA